MSESDQPAKRPAVDERQVDGRSKRWDAHRARRREQLVDAALAVLGRVGRDFGMDEVAHEAGVTKPVIYRHFGYRAALLDAMAERATNRLMERLMPVLYDDGPVRPRIRASIDAVVGFLDEFPNVHLMFRRRLPGQGSAVDDAGREFISGALTGLLHDQLASRGFDRPELVQAWAQMLVGGVQTTAEWWLTRRTMSRDAVTEHLTTLIWAQFDGLARQYGFVLDPEAPLRVGPDAK